MGKLRHGAQSSREPLESHTQSEEFGGHLSRWQGVPSGVEVTTEGNLYQEFKTPAGREQEMGCRNQCPSIFQADARLRRLRRRPGDGTEYQCAACGQSLEGTCQGNHTIREQQARGLSWAGGSGHHCPHPIWRGYASKRKTRAGTEVRVECLHVVTRGYMQLYGQRPRYACSLQRTHKSRS